MYLGNISLHFLPYVVCHGKVFYAIVSYTALTTNIKTFLSLLLRWVKMSTLCTLISNENTINYHARMRLCLYNRTNMGNECCIKCNNETINIKLVLEVFRLTVHIFEFI